MVGKIHSPIRNMTLLLTDNFKQEKQIVDVKYVLYVFYKAGPVVREIKIVSFVDFLQVMLLIMPTPERETRSIN